MNIQHRLLKRQLKKVGLDENTVVMISEFLNQVDNAYMSFDNDLQHLENILELSSQELFQLNAELQLSVADISSQLEKVATHIQEVIFEIDLDLNWSYLNPAWEKLTGLSTLDCIGNAYNKTLIDSRDVELNFVQELIDLKLNAFNKTIEITTVDKELKWCDVSIKVLRNEHGDLEGFIGSIVDITRLKETELNLIDAREKEIKANKAKDEFLSIVSHEIRTPLNVVNGITQLLMLDDPRQDQLENFKALKYSSDQLLSLVNDLLDLNKIEFGALELEELSFSIRDIVNGIQSLFYKRISEKNLQFELDIDPEIPEYLLGDQVRLNQILTNLISNATKFTDTGRIKLSITAEEDRLQWVHLKFQVEDTGIGIPEEKISSIFNTFEQGHSNTARIYGGSGLGLAICKKLISKMGGVLRLKSEVGTGSTFEFSLVFKKNVKLSDQDLMINHLDIVRDLKGAKILVAEDHKMNVHVIKRFFDRWNVEYDIVENGQHAIDFALSNEYDAILMDLQMPILDGYEATHLIRSKNQSIPIFALSAMSNDKIRNKLDQYGINGHITKPFNPDDLYMLLKHAIGKS